MMVSFLIEGAIAAPTDLDAARPANQGKITSEISGGPYSGDLTWFYTGLGACGRWNVETDWIVAVSRIVFDRQARGTNPNNNGLCGQKIHIQRDGHTVEATVVDRCEDCKENDIDVTRSLFQQFDNLDRGRIDIVWWWN
ncbi:hypothetical protein N7508_003611 [Penicillium antarcticum]|uniref:uncharacterized protein n=1 Tax=Penicillium antarcticum TaxID=416450 RepID=UPI0023936442|nr:uncharacterized protein N7508_003611 [Penicillium antarcticum]KAJ5312781.1 hypothetical protein N7508_003611 [Penicillium antarcticum]